MDAVSTLNQALALLRQQLTKANRISPKDGSRKEAAQSNGGTPGSNERGESGISVLKQIVELKELGHLDAHQTTRLIVELVLDNEFPQALRNDPQFQQMVDDVTAGLLDDEDTRILLQKLTR